MLNDYAAPNVYSGNGLPRTPYLDTYPNGEIMSSQLSTPGFAPQIQTRVETTNPTPEALMVPVTAVERPVWSAESSTATQAVITATETPAPVAMTTAVEPVPVTSAIVPRALTGDPDNQRVILNGHGAITVPDVPLNQAQVAYARREQLGGGFEPYNRPQVHLPTPQQGYHVNPSQAQLMLDSRALGGLYPSLPRESHVGGVYPALPQVTLPRVNQMMGQGFYDTQPQGVNPTRVDVRY